ncbi:non-specific lipid transfer protein GPI-anchored 15-like [Panicum virgatum]|nr:non-specific lipid transfer protein GPI-anchored 15-like [Panicum virgatum]
MAPLGRARAAAAPRWLLAAVSLLVAAVAAARPGAGVCTSALVSLSPCVDYMGGNEATALARCCSQLRSVSRSRPQCLCAALRVDRTRELSLTAACGVQTWGLRVGCSDHQ